jgi:hypothetical protein
LVFWPFSTSCVGGEIGTCLEEIATKNGPVIEASNKEANGKGSSVTQLLKQKSSYKPETISQEFLNLKQSTQKTQSLMIYSVF